MHIPAILLATACVLAGCATGAERMQHAEIDRLMDRYAGAVPGASLLVIRDGVDVIRRGYGLADLEAGIEAGPATNYRLASITKQFTAAAILLLAEDGRLRLDDRARAWLPSLPAAADAITLRHLLTHTSGLIDYEDVMPDDARRRAAARCRRAAHARSAGPRCTSSRVRPIATATAAMRCWRWSSNARPGSSFPDFLRAAHLPAAGHARHPGLRGGRPGDRTSRLRLQRVRQARGRAPTRARPAPCSATAASIPRSTTWRNGMRRCTTTAC